MCFKAGSYWGKEISTVSLGSLFRDAGQPHWRQEEKLASLGSAAHPCCGLGPIQLLVPPSGLSQPLHSIHPAPSHSWQESPQDSLGGMCPLQQGRHTAPRRAWPLQDLPELLFPQPDGI